MQTFPCPHNYHYHLFWALTHSFSNTPPKRGKICQLCDAYTLVFLSDHRLLFFPMHVSLVLSWIPGRLPIRRSLSIGHGYLTLYTGFRLFSLNLILTSVPVCLSRAVYQT